MVSRVILQMEHYHCMQSYTLFIISDKKSFINLFVTVMTQNKAISFILLSIYLLFWGPESCSLCYQLFQAWHR